MAIVWQISDFTHADSGQGNYLNRNLIPAANLLVDASRIRIKAGWLVGYTVAEVFIGHRASSGNPWKFDGNQVRVTWDFGNNGFTVDGIDGKWSDEIIFSLDHTKDILISYYSNAASFPDRSGGEASGYTNYYVYNNLSAVGDADVASMSPVASFQMVFTWIESQVHIPYIWVPVVGPILAQ